MLTKRQLEDAAECMSHDCESCGVREFAGGCCQIATAQTAIAYREMLERLEWVHTDNTYAVYCPICGWEKSCGHKPDCKLASLLKESEVEEG